MLVEQESKNVKCVMIQLKIKPIITEQSVVPVLEIYRIDIWFNISKLLN